jgi:hypothetical protein
VRACADDALIQSTQGGENTEEDHHQHAHAHFEEQKKGPDHHLHQASGIDAPKSAHTPSSDKGEEEERGDLLSFVALFDFDAQNEGELSFKQGDHILVAPVDHNHDQASSEWRYGYIDDREGHFPATYIDAASH